MYEPDCNEKTGCLNNDPEKFKFCPDCGKENNRLRDSASLKSGFDIPELTGQVPANRTRIDFGYFHTFPVFTPDKRDVEILFVCSYVADSLNIYEPMRMGEPLEKHVKSREEIREKLRNLGLWYHDFDKTFDERYGVYTMHFHA